MEILATNTSYFAAIFMTIIFGLVLLVSAIGAFTDDELVSKIFGGVISGLAIASLLLIWADPEDVTYDAIVTDWNEVYDAGYEVVEQDGKIVTLRKVDE